MATYDNAIKSWTPEQWQQFGAAGGTIGGNNELLLNGIGLGGNSYNEYMNQSALGGLGVGLTKGGLKDFGVGVDILGTGYDVYSNLFGDKKDMYKTQMSAMKQNMANIAEDRANRRAFQSNIGGGFNSTFGKGLAASSAAPKL